jgi:hypothetical protein
MTEKSPAEKMLLKPGKKVLMVNPPPDLPALIGPLPEGVIRVEGAERQPDIILAFIKDRQELEATLPGLRAILAPGGALWVAYYKGTARIKTDIHRDSINAYAGTLGLTGVAMISIDQDWSALRLKGVA